MAHRQQRLDAGRYQQARNGQTGRPRRGRSAAGGEEGQQDPGKRSQARSVRPRVQRAPQGQQVPGTETHERGAV